MIVVIGNPVLGAEPSREVAGLVARTAVAAARAGQRVQIVGRVGEDAEGDALLLALAREGIGHVAVLRDPANRTAVARIREPDDDLLAPGDSAAADDEGEPTADPSRTLDPDDVELGLRYLTDFDVLVVAEPLPAEVIRVAAEASRYAGARLIVVTGPDGEAPGEAIVLEAPDEDPDGAFAELVGRYAAALDAGAHPAAAWDDALARTGWTRPDATTES